MKTIGLIGGMSWESTAEYYRIINNAVNERLGGLHSAKIVLHSLDFEEIEQLQRQGKWNEATNLMVDAARKVERAGADFALICTNTMHRMAEDVAAAISIPLLHIVDVTAERIVSRGITKVGLLGTKFTMEQDFYRERLRDKYGLDVAVPNGANRETVHNIIYLELCQAKINPASREQVKAIISRLVADGVQGVILGCTELPLLIKEGDCPVPLFNTTEIHALAAVDYAFSD